MVENFEERSQPGVYLRNAVEFLLHGTTLPQHQSTLRSNSATRDNLRASLFAEGGGKRYKNADDAVAVVVVASYVGSESNLLSGGSFVFAIAVFCRMSKRHKMRKLNTPAEFVMTV